MTDWLPEPPVLVAGVIIGVCLLYLTCGRTDEDGEFESGVSQLGLAVVSIVIIVLLIRFGFL